MIKEIIFSNLQSAKDNQYSFDGFTDEDIAADLIAFAEDCSDFKVEDMLPHIKEWRRLNDIGAFNGTQQG
jgi:hypothetical protein